jgi:hypothetical protein
VPVPVTIFAMPSFLLCHRHSPEECGASVAAWRGFPSPLRGQTTVGSCQYGRHRVWWQVEAASAQEALAHLPLFVAQRSDAIRISEQQVP